MQLEELQGSQKDQVLQAERALEEFRAQSEASTSTMLSQMRREVCTYVLYVLYVHLHKSI